MENIMLLHGMGGPNPLNYIETGLVKKFNVCKPVMPGFSVEDGIIKYNDEVYIEYIEEVRKEKGWDKFTVIGYSMGGRTAVNYTLAHQNHVSNLILIDAAGLSAIIPLLQFKFGKKFLKRILPFLLKYSMFQELLGKSDFVNTGSKEYEMGKAWVSDMMKDPVIRKNFVEILTSTGTKIPNIEDKLKNITVPVQILWADKDKTAKIFTVYQVEKYIKNCNVSILHGYRHMALIEKPDFYINNIIEFINVSA